MVLCLLELKGRDLVLVVIDVPNACLKFLEYDALTRVAVVVATEPRAGSFVASSAKGLTDTTRW